MSIEYCKKCGSILDVECVYVRNRILNNTTTMMIKDIDLIPLCDECRLKLDIGLQIVAQRWLNFNN